MLLPLPFCERVDERDKKHAKPEKSAKTTYGQEFWNLLMFIELSTFSIRQSHGQGVRKDATGSEIQTAFANRGVDTLVGSIVGAKEAFDVSFNSENGGVTTNL